MRGDLFLNVLMSASCALVAAAQDLGRWDRLPDLPGKLGVAGAFAGVSNGALIVAGGANFPQGMPWQGGKKVWRDAVWVWREGALAFTEAGKLPRPLAYGVSCSTYFGTVACIGGCDEERHYGDTFQLRWEEGKLSRTDLPPLPIPLAYACAAADETSIWVCGGAQEPGEKRASNRVFVLRFMEAGPRWHEQPALPGKPRILAVAARAANALYVMGGAALEEISPGKIERVYLRDCWRYTDDLGWKQMPDLPKPIAAAASPAPIVDGRILVIAGDDGSRRNFQPVAQHPGFGSSILAFDLKTDRWSESGNSPAPRATLPCVAWGNAFLFPSGEVRPGVRSPEIWRLTPR
jgi:N-acetylneuraminate epimerase